MKISLMSKSVFLLFWFMGTFLAKETSALNDTLCRDSLEIRQQEPHRTLVLPFSYKNVRDYIFNHLSYPPQAIQEEIEGTVLIRFTLMKTGDVDSVQVVAPVHPLLDDEALRLIRNMPKWEPVYLQGQPVELSDEVPVIFELLPPENKQDSLK